MTKVNIKFAGAAKNVITALHTYADERGWHGTARVPKRTSDTIYAEVIGEELRLRSSFWGEVTLEEVAEKIIASS